MHGPSTHGAVTVAMPSTQTKCFLGSKDAYAKVGVPNCHGTSNWSNARTMRSRKHVLAKAAERLTTLVELDDRSETPLGLAAAIELARGRDEAAEKLVAAAQARYSCPGATHACKNCIEGF